MSGSKTEIYCTALTPCDPEARAMSDNLGKSAVTFGLAFLAAIAGAVGGWIVTGFAAEPF